MKILYISPYYSNFIHDPIIAVDAINGFSTYTVFVLNRYLFIKRPDYRNNFRSELLSNEITSDKQRKVFYNGLPQDLFAHKYACQIAKKIERICDFREFDIIHAHTVSPAGVAAKILAEKYNKPFLVTSHGYDFYRLFPENDPKHRGRAYSKKERVSIDIMMQAVSSFIAVSPVFASHVKQLYPEAPVSVIENTYNQALFNIFGKKGNNTGKKVIITIGNFIPVKRHDVCIDAFALLLKRFSNVELKIIGRGPLKQQYEQQCNELGISEYVEIIDHVKQTDLAELMKKADLYVHTSDSETFGLAIVEAMACGLPVISTKTQGPSHVITNGKDGFLVERNNAFAINDTFQSLMSSPAKMIEIGRSAAITVSSRFSSIDRLVSLYKELVGSNDEQ